jgi:hypothetical protein
MFLTRDQYFSIVPPPDKIIDPDSLTLLTGKFIRKYNIRIRFHQDTDISVQAAADDNLRIPVDLFMSKESIPNRNSPVGLKTFRAFFLFLINREYSRPGLPIINLSWFLPGYY